MKKFYRCSNNGVVAVVTEEIYVAIREWGTDDRKINPSFPYPSPVFTFAAGDQYFDEYRKYYVTGTYEMMDALLEGHLVYPGSFYVPFSNQIERAFPDSPQAKMELSYRTTLEEAIEAFGLITDDVYRFAIAEHRKAATIIGH